MTEINLLPKEQLHKYWAAYLNMARYNLFVTLRHISKSVGVFRDDDIVDSHGTVIKRKDEEEGMPYMAIMTDQLQPEQANRAMSLMTVHFPFIKFLQNIYVEDETPAVMSLDEMRFILSTFAYTLSEYRNIYSHYRHFESRKSNIIKKVRENENTCGKFLGKLNTVSTRIIKERYSSNKNSSQKGMIDDNSLKFITEGKVKFKPGPNKSITPNPNYFLNPLTDGDRNNPGRLTEIGLVQLVCLFLDKKYITEFLTQIGFLAAFNNQAQAPKLSEQRLMLEVLSALRIRLPERKLSMEKSELQISLDILNEMRKCPKDLYDLLGGEDKSVFNTVSSTGAPVLFVRSSDRFPQLAISWIDATAAFDKIRFQVNAGNFRYLFNKNKKCIDGQVRQRILQEPMNCFARLPELEQKRLNKISVQNAQDHSISTLWPGYSIFHAEENCTVTPATLPHISDSRARYLIDNGNIGLKFSEFIPEITKESDSKYRVQTKIADCTISVFELPALLFHLYLSKKVDESSTSTEDIIIRTVSNFRKLFSDIADGTLVPGSQISIQGIYGIRYEDIPDKLRNYLEDKEEQDHFAAYKQKLVDQLAEETKYRSKKLKDSIAAVRSSDNKPGKRNFVRLKPGTYASFLAQDIVFLQEAEAKDKMTGLNYSVLQSSIATFTRNDNRAKQSLMLQLVSAGLISGTYGKGTHPFLWKVMNNGMVVDTVSFYGAYLDARLEYLEGIIPDDAAFLHSNRIKWAERDVDYYKGLAQRYLDRPVILPRRLFENDIRRMLLNLGGPNAQVVKESIENAMADGNCNTTFMIQEYMYDYLEDGPQRFYGLSEGDMSHDYSFPFHAMVLKHRKMARELVEELKSDSTHSHRCFLGALEEAISWAGHMPASKPPKNPHKPAEMEYETFKKAVKRLYNEYSALEKDFRRFAAQDCVLFLSAMDTVKKYLQIPEGADTNLGAVAPDSESILDTPVTIKNESPFKTSTTGAAPVLVQKDVKVKDYGDIFRLLRDSRLEGLLSLHSDDEIDVSRIQDELDIYDRSRADVFGNLLDYEKKVTDGIPDSRIVNKDGKIDFNSTLRMDAANNQVTKHTLRLIRNAFSHNSYPAPISAESKTGEMIKLHDCEITGAADRLAKKVAEITEATPNGANKDCVR